jgi:hypothetical protein
MSRSVLVSARIAAAGAARVGPPVEMPITLLLPDDLMPAQLRELRAAYLADLRHRNLTRRSASALEIGGLVVVWLSILVHNVDALTWTGAALAVLGALVAVLIVSWPGKTSEDIDGPYANWRGAIGQWLRAELEVSPYRRAALRRTGQTREQVFEAHAGSTMLSDGCTAIVRTIFRADGIDGVLTGTELTARRERMLAAVSVMLEDAQSAAADGHRSFKTYVRWRAAVIYGLTAILVMSVIVHAELRVNGQVIAAIASIVVLAAKWADSKTSGAFDRPMVDARLGPEALTKLTLGLRDAGSFEADPLVSGWVLLPRRPKERPRTQVTTQAAPAPGAS